MHGKAQRLARPAAPLAACVQRIGCTSCRTLTPSAECHRNSVLWINPTIIGCHDNVLRGIEKKLISAWSSTAAVLSTFANSATDGQADAEVTGVKAIVKIKKSNKKQQQNLQPAGAGPAKLGGLYQWQVPVWFCVSRSITVEEYFYSPRCHTDRWMTNMFHCLYRERGRLTRFPPWTAFQLITSASYMYWWRLDERIDVWYSVVCRSIYQYVARQQSF